MRKAPPPGYTPIDPDKLDQMPKDLAGVTRCDDGTGGGWATSRNTLFRLISLYGPNALDCYYWDPQNPNRQVEP